MTTTAPSVREELFGPTHRAVTEILDEWSNRQGGGFEAVRMIGDRWSERAQHLRDTFTRNRFGPYAEPLNHVLARLEGHYIQGFGDRMGASQIRLEPQALNEAILFLADHPAADEAATRVAVRTESTSAAISGAKA